MTCPNCGAVFNDTSRFCGFCGTPLAPEKKGTHRVPILILIALSIVGICVFFATGGTPAAVPEPDQPFHIENGVLTANYDLLCDETEITVPETVNNQTVTTIGNYAFTNFAYMTQVHLPDTVTEIGYCSFNFCHSLRGIDLPPALTTIGDEAFLYCTGLEAIHIPASVAYIGDDAFDGCDSLAYIFYDGTIDEWQALYDQELNPETAVCCTDGTFYQSQ